MTFPLNKSETGTAAAFATEFGLLVQRLNERLLDRLQAERSPDKRTAIAGFPAQVASLQAPLAEFIGEAFGGSRLDPAPFLRGVYLTSGTQEGTPIDRLTGAMARSFGIDAQRAPTLRPEAGPQLLPDPSAEGSRVRRGDAGVARPGRGAAQPAGLYRHRRGRGAGRGARRRGADPDPRGQQQRHCAVRCRARRLHQGRAGPAARSRSPTPTCRRVAPVLDHGARPAVRRAMPDRRRWQFFPGLDQTGKLGEGAQPGLYPRARQHPVAAPDLPAGSPDAAELQQSRFPVPGDQGLPDARLAAGRWTATSVKAWMHYDWQACVSRSRRCSRCVTRWSSTSPRCSTSRCRR